MSVGRTESGKGVAQGLYHGLCAEIGSAYADTYHYFTLLGQRERGGFDVGNQGFVGHEGGGKVVPAQEVVAGSAAGVEGFEALTGFGHNGVDVGAAHCGEGVGYVYIDLFHLRIVYVGWLVVMWIQINVWESCLSTVAGLPPR